jgi:hypothetical protein
MARRAACRIEPLPGRCDGMRIALRVLTDEGTGEMIVGLSSTEVDILTLESRARGGPSSPTSVNTTPPHATRNVGRATKPAASVDHDAALLPAALEAVEARRVAIEWLLEADLLRLCLV